MMEDIEMRAIRKVRTLLLALLIALVPAASFAGVFVSITLAPPALPVYTQPVCPGDGYLWTPGYWAYGPVGYYWVPGVWVMAPRPGLLWTPGYWGFAGGLYGWHAGYWGPHVGFYGGVNYGYGYGGVGFVGGRWVGGHFAYNTAVLHVNTTLVHNTYIDRTVIHTTVINRTSFNGPGGINARATREEMAAQREQHFGPTSVQASHERLASTNRANFASVNGGRPGGPAMARTAQNNFNHGGNNFNNRPANNFNREQAHPQQANAYHAQPAHNNAPHESRPAGNEHPGGEAHERR
jgi:WXXGXW repeat (2 copies)